MSDLDLSVLSRNSKNWTKQLWTDDPLDLYYWNKKRQFSWTAGQNLVYIKTRFDSIRSSDISLLGW